MTTDSTYHPVYLFLDPELFEAFLRQIPHSTLIEPFKKDEPLRNRTLRGHRFGAGHPDRHRLAKAYRDEIVERANYGLAAYLLKNWVEDRPELISKALARIGVESEVDLTCPPIVGPV